MGGFKLLFKIILLTLVSVNMAFAKKEAEKTYEINWLLAHEPVELFLEAAKHFAKEVGAKTNGKVKVNILSLSDYTNGKNVMPHPLDIVSDLQAGKIQMTQTYTTALGRYNNDMWALDLPFLFKSHDHATKVLDGPIGQQLLAGLERSGIKGLSFTYSGGYRILPTTEKEITRYEDLKGLKVQTSGSPVAKAIFNDLGATAIPGNLVQGRERTKSGEVAGLETTYPRVYALDQQKYTKIINDTKHSLFLTSIIINKDFLNSLPENYRKIVESTAKEAAVLERKISIRDEAKTKNKLKSDGIKIVELSAKEQARFEERLQPIYKKFEKMFQAGLVEKIKSAN